MQQNLEIFMKSEKPTGKFRWKQIFNICDAEWKQIFSLPLRLTKNTKLQRFHFRINYKILSTIASSLHKILIHVSVHFAEAKLKFMGL